MHTSRIGPYDRVVVPLLDRLRDPLLLLVRLSWGWLFFQTGFGKLGNLEATSEFFAGLGLPLPYLTALFVGALECGGGLLLLLGLLGRPIAFLLAGNMVVAYLTAHTGDLGSLRSFVDAAPYPYLLAALIVLAFGPGRLSFDAWLRRARSRSDTIAISGRMGEVRS